jgi:phosphoribosylformylglycinamidine synthase I
MKKRKQVKVIVLRTAGTNCDAETVFAFQKVGASCDLVHINKLVASRERLDPYRILAIPGGFTYGDDIASGKILANEIRCKLKNDLMRFVRDGKLVIGICNGFQVLVKSGFLPNQSGDFASMDVTLSINDSGKFEDRWVYLKKRGRGNRCVWTKQVDPNIYLPVAHAEGKFIPKDASVVRALGNNGQIVFTYCDEKGVSRKEYPWNPNGSVENIAGICDTQGRVFGLMPHPERHIQTTQHPRWTRMRGKQKADGLAIFQGGVDEAGKL